MNSKFDAVVIGGGIYGAAMLWELAHRGLKPILLEKNDFASGTSSNSLKTIHGGIRYLQKLQFNRVLESDREKAILTKIAPSSIKPLNCLLPEGSSISKSRYSYWAGTTFFNILSRCFKGSLSSNGSPYKRASILKTSILNTKSADKYFMSWQDAQVLNSERLVLNFISSAIDYGASAYNYADVGSVALHGDVYETSLKDGQTVKSDYVIDCSSSIDPLYDRMAKDSGYLKPVSAMNLIFDLSVSNSAVALPSVNPDLNKSTMLFFSPWMNSTLAGTWYFNEKVTKANVDKEIVDVCLLDTYRSLKGAGFSITLTELKRKLLDIHLGVLPGTSKLDDPEKSLIEYPSVQSDGVGYHKIMGNKYTTARLNAKKFVDTLKAKDNRIKESKSHEIQLSNESDPPCTLSSTDQSIRELIKMSQVKTVSDLLYRRLNENPHRAFNEKEIKRILELVATELGLNDEEVAQQLAEVELTESSKRSLSIEAR